MIDCFLASSRRVLFNGCIRDWNAGLASSQMCCGGAGGVTERSLGTWRIRKLIALATVRIPGQGAKVSQYSFLPCTYFVSTFNVMQVQLQHDPNEDNAQHEVSSSTSYLTLRAKEILRSSIIINQVLRSRINNMPRNATMMCSH